ncbi:MAG: hypothetical protein M3O34_20085 [Chloroflexota bacterium]|nr:hypothetical protein [Chloroflexota bacterium]
MNEWQHMAARARGGVVGVTRRDFLRGLLAFGTAVTLAPRSDLALPGEPVVPAPPPPRLFTGGDLATPRLPILLDRQHVQAMYLMPGQWITLKYDLSLRFGPVAEVSCG